MPKKIDQSLYILSPSRAYLAPLKVMGPIVHPIKASKTSVVQLLLNGTEVFEYFPDSKRTLKLSLTNINDEDRELKAFGDSVVEIEPPVDPVTKTGVPKIENEDVIEEESETQESPSENKYHFEINANGKVDESKITWSKYTKEERQEIRAEINRINKSSK